MKRLAAILLTLPLLLGISPPSGPTDRANEAFAAGRYDDALADYEKAVEADPDKAEPHYNLGGVYYKKGEYGRALDEYGKALAIDPEMADAYYNSGDALFRLGRYEDALKAYDRADALKKDDPETRHNIVITEKRIRKEQEEKQARAKGGGQRGRGRDGEQPPGDRSGRQSGQRPSQDAGSGGRTGGSGMSDEQVQALLDRQAKEEKRLRNYFRPGRKDAARSREDEIDQMLRGFGLPGLSGRQAKPGAPYVEKDW